MTSNPEPHTSNPTSTVGVSVEVVAWLTKLVGGDGTRRRVFDETFRAGTTVGEALVAFSGRFAELDAALWGAGRREVAEHIEILVNDAVLGVQHSLDSPLVDGDRVTLVGAFMGG